MNTTLMVRLDSPSGSRRLTAVDDVQIVNTSPGGFSSVTVDLSEPMDAGALPSFADVLVFDTQTGEQVGGGRLMEPGSSVSDSGQVRQIKALGEGLASMQDITRPDFYVDRELDQWRLNSRSTRRLEWGAGTLPGAVEDDDPTLWVQAADDKAIAAGANLRVLNSVPRLTGRLLGAVAYTRRAGLGDSDWRIIGRATVGSAAEVFSDLPWSTSFFRVFAQWGVDWAAPFGPEHDTAGLIFQRNSPGKTAGEDDWCGARNPVVVAMRYDAYGFPVYGEYTETVTLRDIFIDQVATRCPRLDIIDATVATTPHAFTQLKWLDGVTALQVLEECLGQEPAYTWHVWEKGPRGWRTELVAKPTDVGYDATIEYGFDLPAPLTEVYDSVHVTGTSPGGRAVSTERTQSIASLSDAGIGRSATINMSEPFTTEAANAMGDAFLADHRRPPGAGSVTIASPILDRTTGRMVQPWNLRSGRLIRLRQPRARHAASSPSEPDGVSVFRIVSVSFNSSSGTATCELDQPVYTERRALADLVKSSKKGRR